MSLGQIREHRRMATMEAVEKTTKTVAALLVRAVNQ
jgi:hypothetical protein